MKVFDQIPEILRSSPNFEWESSVVDIPLSLQPIKNLQPHKRHPTYDLQSDFC